MALHRKEDSLQLLREKESLYSKERIQIIPFGEEIPEGENDISRHCLYLCVTEVNEDGSPASVVLRDCHGNSYPFGDIAAAIIESLMPKTGGMFVGDVVAAASENTAPQLRNIAIFEKGTDLSTISVPAGTIIMVKK